MLNWTFFFPGTTAVIAVLGVDRDDRRGRVAALVERRLDGPDREPLVARVDGGVDAKTAAADRRGAVLVDELLTDVAEEVRLADLRVDLARLQAERRLDSAPVVGLVDVAGVQHRRQNLVPPAQGVVRLAKRVVDGGRLRQARDESRLLEVEVGRALREVRLRRRLRAVRVAAEVDLVQVRLEDLVLPPVLEPVGVEAGGGKAPELR
jgi:hypothetical protein